MRTKLTLIHVVIPLAIGGILYICFRSTSLRMFDWFEMIGIDSLTLGIRNLSKTCKEYLPSWTYYSLPGGLWVYSFSSAYIILWGKTFAKLKFWLMIPLLFGAGVELLQFLELFPGTFDVIDFTFCLSALLLSIIIVKPKNEHYEKAT